MKYVYTVLGACLFIASAEASVSPDRVQNIYTKLTAANSLPVSHIYVKEGVVSWCSVACALGPDIIVSTELLDSAENEEEVAFIIGHELGHISHLGESEMDADIFGLDYINKAGYNGCKGAQILKTFMGDKKHPDGTIRYANTKCS